MSTIKLFFSTLVIALSLTVTSTANTLPVPTDIVPVELEQAESMLDPGTVRLSVLAAGAPNFAGYTPLRLFSRATDPDGILVELTLLVNGQPIKTSTTNRVIGRFVPTAPGTYVITSRATYEGFVMVFSTPTTIVVD